MRALRVLWDPPAGQGQSMGTGSPLGSGLALAPECPAPSAGPLGWRLLRGMLALGAALMPPRVSPPRAAVLVLPACVGDVEGARGFHSPPWHSSGTVGQGFCPNSSGFKAGPRRPRGSRCRCRSAGALGIALRCRPPPCSPQPEPLACPGPRFCVLIPGAAVEPWSRRVAAAAATICLCDVLFMVPGTRGGHGARGAPMAPWGHLGDPRLAGGQGGGTDPPSRCLGPWGSPARGPRERPRARRTGIGALSLCHLGLCRSPGGTGVSPARPQLWGCRWPLGAGVRVPEQWVRCGGAGMGAQGGLSALGLPGAVRVLGVRCGGAEGAWGTALGVRRARGGPVAVRGALQLCHWGSPIAPGPGAAPIRQLEREGRSSRAWGPQGSRGGGWSQRQRARARIPWRRWLGEDPTVARGHPVPRPAGPQPAAPRVSGNPPAAGTGMGTVPAGTRRARLPGPAPAGGTP